MNSPVAPSGARSALGRRIAVLASAFTVACVAVEPRSDAANPLGWPARGLTGAGFALEDSEVPVVVEIGALIRAIGRLADAPALLIESVVTFSPRRAADAGEALVVGAGKTLTAALNVPFSIVIGSRVDLGRDADTVNDALATLAAETDATGTDDAPPPIPVGTTVRASGRNLVWSVPGRGEVLQRAEKSWLFHAMTSLPGQERYTAQERSWGFVVPTLARWDGLGERTRAITIVHEMAHQLDQIERRFAGWSLVYWPSYHGAFVVHGWDGHWAETGPRGAQRVDRALVDWAR